MSLVLGERYKIGDIIAQEAPNFYSRKMCKIAPSQTLKLGQIVQGDVYNGQLSALGSDASGVNAVQTVTITGTLSAGNIGFSIGDYDFEIPYNSTFATALASLNTNIASAYGASAGPVATASGAWASLVLTFTFSGTAVAAQPQPLIEVDLTNATGVTAASVAQTTAGVAAGSGTNQVDVFNITGTIGTGGQLGIKIGQENGDFIDIQASTATNATAWVAAINAAITTSYGASGIGPVVTGTAYTAITVTYSGSAFSSRPILEDIELDFTYTYNVVAGDTTYTYTKTTTTAGVRPTGAATASAIILQDITTTSLQAAPAECLVRQALVKPGYLVYGANCTSAADQAAARIALARLGLEVRNNPSYTYSQDVNTSETVTTPPVSGMDPCVPGF